jgi:Immunity protein 27
MLQLSQSEKVIEGRWLIVEGRVVSDDAAQRIEKLCAGHLTLVARSADGWANLFRDPVDGRLWERTFPQGSSHGGGPPKLEVISTDDARFRYLIAS